MEKNIAVIKGDGIGPEIVTEAMKVLDKVAAKYGHKFNYEQLLMGGCSIDANGVPLTHEISVVQAPGEPSPGGRSAQDPQVAGVVRESSSLPAVQ